MTMKTKTIEITTMKKTTANTSTTRIRNEVDNGFDRKLFSFIYFKAAQWSGYKFPTSRRVVRSEVAGAIDENIKDKINGFGDLMVQASGPVRSSGGKGLAAARRWRLLAGERPQRRGWREGGAVPSPGAEEVPWCYGGTEEVPWCRGGAADPRRREEAGF